ncbi:MAG TPA: aldehyde dehydrogenase family protein, partial [Dongiaceae bacterium]|nr:aldehyde dehydrogenase family protein [Dongiaceae bacterium]
MSAALSLENFRAQAAGLTYRSQAFINGKYVSAASGKTFDNINPATGKVINQVASGDKEDVDRAVAAARAAFEKGSWANMAPSDRKKVLIRFADLIDKHNDELALL